MRVLFMGSGTVACPALERLLQHPNHAVVAVVTQPDKPQGRNRKVAPCPAKAYAEAQGVPVLTPAKVGAPDAVAALRELKPDLLVVAAYGQYIKPEILDIPPLGAINIHPSLLPKYRGATPIQWAIANGDTETGVTILYVSEKMDAGDIILQRSCPINDEDTALTLTPRLSEMGADLLLEAIASIEAGTATRHPQDEQAVTVVHKLSKEDGCVDWSLPATVIRNRLRGFTPWPGCYTTVKGKRLNITRVSLVPWAESAMSGEVVRCDEAGPVVATGQGALCLCEVQPEGKKVMPGSAYLCGRAVQVGDRLGV